MNNLQKITTKIFVLAFLMLWQAVLYAQKPIENRQLEILVDEREDYIRVNNVRFSKETGVPLALYHVNFSVRPGPPEEMAREYLRNNARVLRIKEDLNDLVHTSTRETPGGFHVRFLQFVEAYPIYDGDIVVNINRQFKVTFVMNSYKPLVKLSQDSPHTSLEEAKQIAKDYLDIKGSLQSAQAGNRYHYLHYPQTDRQPGKSHPISSTDRDRIPFRSRLLVSDFRNGRIGLYQLP